MTDTSPTVDLLGPEDLRPLVLDIIERMPDNVNPVDSVGVRAICLYNGPDGSHCIAGQLGAEQGWNLEDADEYGGIDEACRILGWPVTDDGAQWLEILQQRADNLGEPVPWREVEVPPA